MKRVSRSGNGGAFWLLISAVLLLFESTRQTGGQCIWALLVTTAIGEGLLKHIFRRPRPFVTHGPIHLVIPMPTGFSFPSGHMASSVAAALIFVPNGSCSCSAGHFLCHTDGHIQDLLKGPLLDGRGGRRSGWILLRQAVHVALPHAFLTVSPGPEPGALNGFQIIFKSIYKILVMRYNFMDFNIDKEIVL